MRTVSSEKLAEYSAKADMFLTLQSRMLDTVSRTFEDIKNFYESVYALEFIKEYYTEYNVEQKELYSRLEDTVYMMSDGKLYKVLFSYDLPYNSSFGKPRHPHGVPLGWSILSNMEGVFVDSGLGFYSTYQETLNVLKSIPG